MVTLSRARCLRTLRTALRQYYTTVAAGRECCAEGVADSAGSVARVLASTAQVLPQTATHDRQAGYTLPYLVRLLGAAAAATGLAWAGSAHTGNEKLNRDALEGLARDLQGSAADGAVNGADSAAPSRAPPATGAATADRERAASMLSGLTIYLEHHPALLAAGVLPALLATVMDASDGHLSQVRATTLGCAADLMKNQEAHQAVAETHGFLPCVLEAYQTEGAWALGPEQGGASRAQAARLLAELAGDPGMHELLVQSGAAQAMGKRCNKLAKASQKHGKTFATTSAVPGNLIEHSAVDEERFSATGLFGLTGSPTGVAAMLDNNGNVLEGLVLWANSNDPILQRYGVGSMARIAIDGSEGAQAALQQGGLTTLISALNSSDPQAQCYAAGALGKLVKTKDRVVDRLIQEGAPGQLLRMLTPQEEQSASSGTSQGVRNGVYRCALRCLLQFLDNDALRQVLQDANALDLLQGLKNDSQVTPDVQQLADSAAARLYASD